MNHYRIKLVRFDSGERFPILCTRQDGMPVLSVTLWVLTELRAAHVSTSTLTQAPRPLMVLFIVLDELKIDLCARLRDGQFLTVGDSVSFASLTTPSTKDPASSLRWGSSVTPVFITINELASRRNFEKIYDVGGQANLTRQISISSQEFIWRATHENSFANGSGYILDCDL